MPLSGVTVHWGSHTATTGSDGTFSVSLGQSSGTVTDDLGLAHSGFLSSVLKSVAINASSPPSVVVSLYQTSTPASTATITISHITSGGVDIANGTSVGLSVVANHGATNYYTTTYASGVSFQVPIRASNALVAILAGSGGRATVSNVDLSAGTASLGTLALSSSPVTYSNTINGEYVSYFFRLDPYGLARLNGQLVGYDNATGTTGSRPFMTPPSGSVVSWMGRTSGTINTDYNWATSVYTSLAAFSTTPTLGSLASGSFYTAGPSAAPTYSGGVITLSAPTPSNVSLYTVAIIPSSGSGSFSIVSPTPSVTVPQWVLDAVGHGSATLRYSVQYDPAHSYSEITNAALTGTWIGAGTTTYDLYEKTTGVGNFTGSATF